MSLKITGRALHWVYKVADRGAYMAFTDMLGFTPLRHEEFEEGCDAACNGPYYGKWSKTMSGYGDEDESFVVELTYNYAEKAYALGNDGVTLHLASDAALAAADRAGHRAHANGSVTLFAPAGAQGGGPAFRHVVSGGEGKVTKVAVNVMQLERSVAYWCGLLGMTAFEQEPKRALVGFGSADDGKCKLELVETGEEIVQDTAIGRMAFACPEAELQGIQDGVLAAGHDVLTRLVTLPTPGKADVVVTILADPDGYEICFVGETGFRDLSKTDPAGRKLRDDAMSADGSEEWWAKNEAKMERMAKKRAAKAAEAAAAAGTE